MYSPIISIIKNDFLLMIMILFTLFNIHPPSFTLFFSFFCIIIFENRRKRKEEEEIIYGLMMAGFTAQSPLRWC